MSSDQFARTQMLLGREKMERLFRAKVAIFGVGGVGGFAVEAMARSGIGSFFLVDSDTVCLSNLNRQIIATHKTIGQYKVDVMRERILDINPDAEVEVRRCFYLPETADEFDFSDYDYVVDAVDTLTAKLEIVQQAQHCGTPVISAMGAGNKLDPTCFQVTDIYKTTMDPLARVMRHECRRRGIEHLKVVYSTEPPMRPVEAADSGTPAENRSSPTAGLKPAPRRDTPGSTAFVPSVAGLILAGEVIKDLVGLGNL